jgi:hypothetical protein
MQAPGWFLALCLVLRCLTQSTSDSSQSVITLTGSAATAAGGDYATSGTTYADQTATTSLSSINYATATDLSSYLSSILATANGTAAFNSSRPTNTTSSSPTQTLLVGSAPRTTALNGTSTGNSSTSSTYSSARPTNTVPCNGHAQFCNRQYSNITYIGAHNSPFVRPGNLASNQALHVETQLNDGIRMCGCCPICDDRACC